MSLFKLKDIKKIKRVEIRLSDAEKDLLEQEVNLLCMFLTDYIMKCALAKATRKMNTTEVRLKLMSLVTTQREIWALDNSQEHLQRSILDAIGVAFREVPDRVANKLPQFYLPITNGKKEARVSMRLTEAEWITLNRKASESNHTLSQYILHKALTRPKTPRIIQEIADQLSEYEKMLDDLVANSLLKSPIYLTVQNELLEYVKSIPDSFRKDCYICTNSKNLDSLHQNDA